MPVTFDAVSGGQIVAGPNTNTLNSGWTHTSGAQANLILVGFQYNHTCPIDKSITRTVTVGGNALTPLIPWYAQRGKGWGAPRPGLIEVWAGVGAAAAGGSVVANLGYSQIANDPLSPASATFSQYSGISLTYKGVAGIPDQALRKGVTGRRGQGRFISVPIPAFMGSLSVIFIGSDGQISGTGHATQRFLDANSNFWMGDHQGPGTILLQNKPAGSPKVYARYGAVVINLQPAGTLPTPVA